MSKKVNVYKTIEKVIENIDFGTRFSGISGISGKDYCYDIFYEDNEELLDDFESEEFKEVVDYAIDKGGIYLALFGSIDDSYYGIIIDNNLEVCLAQRFYGNYASGQTYERLLDETDVTELINTLIEYIIYE